MNDMEELDKQILEWIAAHTADPGLREQLINARVKRRDYMRTGFFLYFERVEGQSPAASGERPVNPHIDSPELMDGAGCNLFLRDGYLHYLEVYSRGGFMPEKLEQFALREAG